MTVIPSHQLLQKNRATQYCIAASSTLGIAAMGYHGIFANRRRGDCERSLGWENSPQAFADSPLLRQGREHGLEAGKPVGASADLDLHRLSVRAVGPSSEQIAAGELLGHVQERHILEAHAHEHHEAIGLGQRLERRRDAQWRLLCNQLIREWSERGE
jgi:hypothetical protein